MGRIWSACLVMMLLFPLWVGAQGFQDPFKFPEESSFDGGVGLTWIDGESFTTFTLAPDLAFGKVGIGIYLQLLFANNNSFKLREDEYNSGAKILKAIRYIRYGQKYDPYYFRVGTIDRASLANGFLVWNYNNGSSYDQRRIGLQADIDLGKVGFESIWSSIGTSNLRGANLYFRPFRFMQTPPPVLDKIRVYGTLVRDNKVARLVPGDSTVDGTLTSYGIGIDWQWLNLPLLKSTVYSEYARHDNFGSGKATGIYVIIPKFVGVFGLAARFEKRFNNARFLPNLYGPLYDLDRQLALLDQLAAAPKTEGYFGELSGQVLNRVRLLGSFQKLNAIPNTGTLHLEASAPNLIPRIEVRGYYDKTGIETFEDARTLDNRSILTAEASYELNRFLLVTMIYRWYWVETGDNTGIFKPVERIEPRLSFRYSF